MPPYQGFCSTWLSFSDTLSDNVNPFNHSSETVFHHIRELAPLENTFPEKLCNLFIYFSKELHSVFEMEESG